MKTNYNMRFKTVLLLGLINILFIGCTSKNQSNINSYIIQHEKYEKKETTIKLTKINDQRETKVVSKIYIKDKVRKEFGIDVDLKQWYREALTRELKSLNMLNDNSTLELTVNIKELKATYRKYSTNKDNMKANILLELILKNKNKTTTMNINLDQTMYKLMILDAQGFETILNEIMSSSVSKSIRVLLSKL